MTDYQEWGLYIEIPISTWTKNVNLLYRLRRTVFPRHEKNDRRQPLQVSMCEVERLEPRLCLGGFAAAGITDLYDDDSQNLTSLNSLTDDTPFVNSLESPFTIRYDFRDHDSDQNLITAEQILRAEEALKAWSNASGNQIEFVRDTTTPIGEILNIGVGGLESFGYQTLPNGVLGVGGGTLSIGENQQPVVNGVAWLDRSEKWDTEIGNGNPAGTRDFYTVVSHEIGHALGYDHATSTNLPTILSPTYTGELSNGSIASLAQNGIVAGLGFSEISQSNEIQFQAISAVDAQLSVTEVKQLLDRATAATPSRDAIIAVVDRGGNILGVRTEDGVVAPNDAVLSFMIDGAVAKARTAAFFSNGDPTNGTLAPLTSRLVRFISQSTITQREVESNPNDADPQKLGPGLVAPIGVGGHFPPEILHTPTVDLFGIEQTNRDSRIHAGANGIRENGGGDDITLAARFDAGFVAGQAVNAPESYGFVSGRASTQQARGIATLPGGIPLFRDSNGDGVGDLLVGGIGVFFPGTDGYATFEQGFVPKVGQTELQRTNASRVQEAEFIALAAAGGSRLAKTFGTGAPGAKVGTIGGIAPVPNLDLPFGVLTLVGITLQVVGPTAGIEGVRQTLAVGRALGPGVVNGTDQPLDLGGNMVVGGGDDTSFAVGTIVPEGWLVDPKAGVGISAAEVRSIIERGIQTAEKVRAAVRLPLSSRTRMVFSITDTTGEVLGLYRMKDATFFSIDVAVAKARNVDYYADPAKLKSEDRVPGIAAGVAFSNRTFRFLAEGRFPSGVDGSTPPVFSILNDPSINNSTAENVGAPASATDLNGTVLGFNSFNPGTNFRDDSTPLEHQNGVVFFPGSTPLYRNGTLIGGFGVSGDGVDQDDVVTFIAARDFLPSAANTRADQTFVDGVRLPYIKFLRNPFG